MVALINLLPVAVLLAGLWLAWRLRATPHKAATVAVLTVGLLVLYAQLQPSYAPKGTVQRSTLPDFEAVDAPISDRLSKPMSNDERDERMKKSVTEGLPR